MKQQRKPITPEMIRRYFGQDARITSLRGLRYWVRTGGRRRNQNQPIEYQSASMVVPMFTAPSPFWAMRPGAASL